jgi:phosphonatase-like hydrolase
VPVTVNAVGSLPIELVVIDPSGTVMLDDEAVGVALTEAVGAVDPDIDVFQLDECASYVAHTRGISILAVIRSLLGDDERARYALRAFELAFPAVLAQGGVDAVPGAEAALHALRQVGRRVCLMTRLPQSCVTAIVEMLGWSDLIDLAIGPSDTTRTPPHPDLVLSAIMQLSVSGVRDVAVVADSVNPLVAGTRAGATAVVGVIGGRHACIELERVPHTHVVHSITDLPALLDVVSTRVDAA